MALNDGASAVHACGALLARRDDEAAWFEKKQEHGHPRGQS